jgi:hypothetical protein
MHRLTGFFETLPRIFGGKPLSPGKALFGLLVIMAVFALADCKQPVSSGSSGDGSPSESSEPDTTPPAAVTDLTVSAGDGHVLIFWTDPADADFEKVEITFTPAAGGITQTIVITRGTQKADLTGLTNGTEYTFTVTTVDASGNRKVIGEAPSAAPGVGKIAVNRTTLQTTMGAAAAAKTGVTVSADGSNVAATAWWVTQAQLTALEAAITAAKTAYGNNAADAAAVSGAKTALDTAIALFNAQKKAGTNSGAPPPPADKSALTGAITAAEALLGSTTVADSAAGVPLGTP